ncbi:MAG: ABC transporter permease, partial [Chlamydiia bacterium]|nr:ABC transporter permease [Chlamydiia bacterium]
VARWDSFWHTVLPTCALAIGPSAFIARLFGARLQEIYSQDYIKLAQAKGLSEWRIAFFHVLPNAILPVLPYLGQLLTGLLVGSFVVEKIFGIPGLGQWFISSVLYRDYNVIMGITFFYGFLLLSMMLLVDMIALWIDPLLRVRQQ